MGWGSIYKRRVRVFTLAVMIYLDYKTTQQREKWMKTNKHSSLWKKAHDRNAKRVLKAMVELEGLWVKLGQYLSTRADVLPQAYIDLLRQLQDSLPPRALKEVFQTIQKEFGKSVDELFLKFDNVPLATASIAQVHRATQIDGKEVVVKVQHHGIKGIILDDLKNAKSIVDWIAWAEPQYNFNPMIDEWCKEAPKELDFNIEAENTRKVSRNLGCHNTSNDSKPLHHVDVLIPEIIQSTEKVLILEYMDGVRLNDSEALDALGVDKQKIVEEITRAYAHQIYVDGFFNGDPHPGNFLVKKDPPHQPILLDFGLTKSLSSDMKNSLAKMFLASAEGDYVALLSSLSEMGLKLRLDMPEQTMEVANVFFRSSTPANEASENVKNLVEQRSRNMKQVQEKMKLDKKEMKRFNPVDAFPGDIVIFTRVINLLRGLSSTMNTRVVYIDIMRPFAESALQSNIIKDPTMTSKFIHDSPVLSDVEAKLRLLLLELANSGKILGIQVSAYKDGEVIIDTSAGTLGKYDPRPVQPDSLFPVFSVTKGITAGMLHWLVDNGKLRLDDRVADIWPEFGSNGKDQIKVHHVLNHTSGLHNAMSSLTRENPLLMTKWDECLNHVVMAVPESEPGNQQIYHYLSFGWLVGGIIERASGKKFQEILDEVFVHPLNISGELYIGIPPGVESRLATLTVDMDDLTKVSAMSNLSDMASSFQAQNFAQIATTLPVLFNSLHTRRSIIPAANGHCSARALARYYASLVGSGSLSLQSPPSDPPLGSHQHIPEFASHTPPEKQSTFKLKDFIRGAKKKGKAGKSTNGESSNAGNYTTNSGKVYLEVPTTSDTNSSVGGRRYLGKIYNNPNILDEFLGRGEYENLVVRDGHFGLGFRRSYSTDGELIGFGHSGMGGSTGYCDINSKVSIAVTLNKMSFGGVTAKIIQLVCSELNIPVPRDVAERARDSQMNLEKPLIN